MAVLMSDDAVIERVLEHATAKTTDLGERVWREPVEHYLSQDRFDLEALDRTQYGDRRGDHAVAVQKGRPEEPRQHQYNALLRRGL